MSITIFGIKKPATLELVYGCGVAEGLLIADL
jgi:hypothetical protein